MYLQSGHGKVNKMKFSRLIIIFSLSLSFLLIKPTQAQTTSFEQVSQLGRGVINNVDWNTNGDILAVASGLDGLWLYTSQFDDIIVSQVHQIEALFVQWSPIGDKLAVLTDKIEILNPVTFELIQTIQDQGKFEWSPDGTKLAVYISSDIQSIVHVWDLTTNELIGEIIGHSSSINSVKWSPDGSKVATASDDDTVKIWDSVTYQELNSFPTVLNAVAVAWSPDSTQVAANTGNSITIWNIDTGFMISILEGHNASILWLDWNTNGLASTDFDGTTYVWDTNIGEINASRISSNVNGQGILWKAQSSTLTIVELGRVINWNIETSQEITLHKHPAVISSICWINAQTIISSGLYGLIQFWNVLDGKLLAEYIGHNGKNITTIDCLKNTNQFVTVDSDSAIQIWDFPSGNSILTFVSPVNIVYAISASPNEDMIASGDSDGVIRIWDINTAQIIATLTTDSKEVSLLEWSSDGTRLAGASLDGSLIVWDTINYQAIFMQQFNYRIAGLGWEDTNHLLIFGDQKLTQINLDLSTSNLILETDRRNNSQAEITDSILIYGDRGQDVFIWDILSKESVTNLNFTSSISAISAFDDTIFAISEGGSIRVFLDTSIPRITLTEYSMSITESGTSDTYTLALGTQPTADVVVSVTGTDQIMVSPVALTFTPENWDVPQTVTVSAVDDSVVEGDHTAVITHSAVSADAGYNGISVADVTVSIEDDE